MRHWEMAREWTSLFADRRGSSFFSQGILSSFQESSTDGSCVFYVRETKYDTKVDMVVDLQTATWKYTGCYRQILAIYCHCMEKYCNSNLHLIYVRTSLTYQKLFLVYAGRVFEDRKRRKVQDVSPFCFGVVA